MEKCTDSSCRQCHPLDTEQAGCGECGGRLTLWWVCDDCATRHGDRTVMERPTMKRRSGWLMRSGVVNFLAGVRDDWAVELVPELPEGAEIVGYIILATDTTTGGT